MKRPLCFLCIIFIMGGMIALKAVRLPPADYTAADGRPVTVTGRVVGKELRLSAGKQTALLTVKAETAELTAAWEDAGKTELTAGTGTPNGRDFPGLSGGKVLCYLSETAILPPLGSTVQIRGKLSAFDSATNPGQFSAADYYRILNTDFRLYNGTITAMSKSYSRYREALFRVREAMGKTLDRYFSAADASVMRTMLLGESGQTDREIKELYQRNGIIHILAISGLHISLIGMGIFRLLRRLALPLPAAVLLAIAVMLSYGVMTNMGASSLRAIIMFIMRMIAYLLGRTYDLLTALAAAAILILFEQPLYLEHSGFIFSFAAVLAIGLFIPAMNAPPEKAAVKMNAPPGKAAVKMSASPGKAPAKMNASPGKAPAKTAARRAAPIAKIIQSLGSGFYISAVTLPIYLLFYYQFPLYSVFINLIVIPLLSVVMLTGILTVMTGMMLPAAGKLISAVPALILTIYEQICLFCDRLPGGNLILGKPPGWRVVIYVIILLLLIIFHRKLVRPLRLVILTGGILILVFRRPVGLTVTFMDVGQGDGIFIQSPSGHNYLIDGGSSDEQAVGKYRILPCLKYQGVKRLDGWFITHPDQDHSSAFAELLAVRDTDGIPVSVLILPDISEESKDGAYRELEQMAGEAEITLEYISQGEMIRDGDFSLTCLHPGRALAETDSNAYSTVLYLQYRAFTALFTGDIEGPRERELASLSGLPALKGSPALKGRPALNDAPARLTVLKVAHHGSRNSSPPELLRRIAPLYAVISAGAGNAYGHPHAEVLARLAKQNTTVFITCDTGAMTFKTNGEKLTIIPTKIGNNTNQNGQ